MPELDKKLMQTPDLNKERMEKLKSLFPDLFTVEGMLNPDELKKIVDPALVKETERFEFKWFGKSEAKRTAFTPSKATLVYDEERSINPEYADGNMIIEGENLETLKCLLSSYREQVKCIFIDPPYNKDKEFIYSDIFRDGISDYLSKIESINTDGDILDTNLETSGRYHSNWLNMMYSRLLLARQLLNDTGVLFITIDDNECYNLKKLCDEIFDANNFLGSVIWNSTKSVTNTALISVSHTFLLIYMKDKDYYVKNRTDFRLPEDGNGFSNPDNDPRGPWKADPFQVGGWRPNQQYEIKNPITGVVYKPNPGASWKNEYEVFKSLLDDNRIVFGVSGEARPQRKRFLTEAEERGKVTKTLWDELDTTTNATVYLKNIFGANVFDNPKPIDLIKKCLLLCAKENDIVLDFFGGSGTTADATIQLCKEDNIKRKFIVVQFPEKITDETETGKIALENGYQKISDITIERNKRVIQKIEKEEAGKQSSLLDIDKKPFKTGFKVYKLAKSNFPRVDFAPDPAKTEKENLALLNNYIAEKEAMFLAMVDEKNIFDEVLLKNGFLLNYSKEKADGFSKNKVFHIKDDFKECLICMEMNIAKETLKELEQYKDKIFICLERALDTTMKWNLKHLLGDKLIAF